MYTYLRISSSTIRGIRLLVLSINTECVVVVASSVLRIVIVSAVCCSSLIVQFIALLSIFFKCNLHCYVIFILLSYKSECPRYI